MITPAQLYARFPKATDAVIQHLLEHPGQQHPPMGPDDDYAPCPNCVLWHDLAAGEPVLMCSCGYCAHAALDGAGVCQYCGESAEDLATRRTQRVRLVPQMDGREP